MKNNTGSLFRQTAAPDLFSANAETDPKDWLERYDLIARINGWSDDDKVALVQLYLDKKEVLWFKKNKSKFTDWKSFCEAFKSKYSEEENELDAWEKIKTIKLKDYNSIEELEIDLEELLLKAKVSDKKTKWNALVSSLDTKLKRKILKAELKEWDEVVKHILQREKFERFAEEGSEEEAEDKVTNEKKVVRRHPNTSAGEPLVEALIEKFEKVSLNMIYKMDQTLERVNSMRYRNNNSSRTSELLRDGRCFHCQEKGHRKFECPDLRKPNRNNGKIQENQKINSIELLNTDTNAEKPTEDKEQEVWLVDKRSRETNEQGDVSKPTAKRYRTEAVKQEDIKMKEIAVKRTRVVNKKIPSMAVGVEKYSIRKDLMEFQPTIKLPQLLLEAPRIRSEYLELGKNVEQTQMNQFHVSEFRTTNCRALVEVYNEYVWAVVDTGAACSVINLGLLERLGLQVEQKSKQILVTADGGTHETAGKVFRVPISIAGYKFPVDLLVIERKDDFLVLGTDWFVEHQVKLDMSTKELTLPKEQADVIISISTKLPGVPQGELTELFIIFKENIDINMTDQFDDPRIQEVKERNKDLFISEIEELKQTDLVEHTITLTEERPIKQKPYRIPHHLREKVMTELEVMAANGVITPLEAKEEEPIDIFTLDYLYFSAIKEYLQNFNYPSGADEAFRKKLRNKARKYTLRGETLYKRSKGTLKEVLHERNIHDIVKTVHEESHHGIENTWRTVIQRYSGEGLYEVVKNVVMECLKCQYYKGNRVKRSKLTPIVGRRPFEIFGLDAVGPINPVSKSGNRFILTGIDYLTKWPVAQAVIQEFGVPAQIITDRGAGFLGEVAQNVTFQPDPEKRSD
ncbi:Gypsy retrotransposon integrase-like protein 1 [Zancudomyces culisetae]|uniref:Gypsy retrotransposon integrase-like protein 1 n=1 Tax=Zancudomyces culisetae TaxID=1213189 RepID=A0A1R1PFV5_ZANCU|nr:Gypsy retrotransposon integrase-like protein 1 [Zancudomyces culisetae]|eukprot:OMH79742.1 Gypsy retrotransposon integrase-like protein 1 [Zancudomyces culisetae]